MDCKSWSFWVIKVSQSFYQTVDGQNQIPIFLTTNFFTNLQNATHSTKNDWGCCVVDCLMAFGSVAENEFLEMREIIADSEVGIWLCWLLL
jgi:hypothetical protein